MNYDKCEYPGCQDVKPAGRVILQVRVTEDRRLRVLICPYHANLIFQKYLDMQTPEQGRAFLAENFNAPERAETHQGGTNGGGQIPE